MILILMPFKKRRQDAHMLDIKNRQKRHKNICPINDHFSYDTKSRNAISYYNIAFCYFRPRSDYKCHYTYEKF